VTGVTMLAARGVSKRYAARTALADVDLDVAEGEAVALLGPNGAGKTTLLRILALLARPSAGQVRIAGLDPARHGDAIRRQIGYLAHHTLLYGDLSARQNLAFYARLYGLADGRRRGEDLLERVGLEGRGDDPVRTYSRGMQQRLAIARALLHAPRLLLFDEPYAGLDAAAVALLDELLTEAVGAGCTLLMATHDLDRARAHCTRYVALERGRLGGEGAWGAPVGGHGEGVHAPLVGAEGRR
jgi:heme exporter protein A